MGSYMPVFFQHVHTPYSIESTEDVLGERVENHVTDIPAMVDALDRNASINAAPIFLRAEHYRADPAYFDETYGLPAVVAQEYDGDSALYDRHMIGEIGETPFAVINGVEASYNQWNSHVILAGTRCDNDDLYVDAVGEELVETDSAFLVPVHPMQHVPGVLDFSIPDDELDHLIDAADAAGQDIALEAAMGYDPVMNALSRGWPRSLRKRGSLVEYAADGVPVLGGLDLHVAFHPRLEGVSVPQEETAFEELWEGDIPVENLLDSDVVSYGGGLTEGMSYTAAYRDTFGNVFAGVLPDNPVTDAVFDRSVPLKRAEYEAVHDRYVEALADADLSGVSDSLRDPAERLL